MTSKERLEQYIKEDTIYQDYLNKHSSYVSDFDKFCIEHCQDIKNILEENEELKKQLEVGEEQYNDLVEEKEELEGQLSSITLKLEEYKKQVNEGLYNVCLPYRTGYDRAVEDKKNQQKEFIKYLEEEFDKVQNDIENEIDNNIKFFKIERRQTITEILQKYKEIIGDVEDEK